MKQKWVLRQDEVFAVRQIVLGNGSGIRKAALFAFASENPCLNFLVPWR